MTETETPSNRPRNYIIFAFLSLGFLIGNLIGLTAESVVSAFLPLLFSFVGGSIIIFITKVPSADRIDASLAIGALSLSCLVGVYASVLISERQLMTPASVAAERVARDNSVEAMKYLRSEQLKLANSVDQRFRNEQIDAAQAYSELKQIFAGTPEN